MLLLKFGMKEIKTLELLFILFRGGFECEYFNVIMLFSEGGCMGVPYTVYNYCL